MGKEKNKSRLYIKEQILMVNMRAKLNRSMR